MVTTGHWQKNILPISQLNNLITNIHESNYHHNGDCPAIAAYSSADKGSAAAPLEERRIHSLHERLGRDVPIASYMVAEFDAPTRADAETAVAHTQAATT